ncbi:MAG: asparagine synthase (glutamine-hydrolyzing) [Candidatus Omnitrophota bacterium]
MCGIAGIISSNKKNISQARLKAMGDSLSHRGPDDQGYLILDHLGFAHRRLSIIDLVTGHQPMSNQDGSVWVVYNGEIYNYIELRSELISRGYKFRTNSDTEVIIHLYEECGEKLLTRLNGMFAFTIYDKKRDKIFSARDHFGIKPFYYLFNKDEFIFASEIKAILSVSGSSRSENTDAIYDYINFQFCLGDKTFFKGIKKLLPGHYLVLDNISQRPRLSVHKYWGLDFDRIDYSHNEKYFADKLLSLIRDSVKLQLRSDVPLGAHLSGGLDSSVVSCLASGLLGKRIKTFTGAFDESREYDETTYARKVSRYIKSEYFEIRPTANDFKQSIARIIYMMDEPVAGPGVFPQFFVSKLASQKVKVVLGGQGGDELFGGYARYLIAYLEQSLKAGIFQSNEEGRDAISLEQILPNLHILKEYKPLLQSFFSNGLFGNMDRRYFDLINKTRDAGEVYSSGILDTGKRYDIFGSYQELFNGPRTGSYINKMIHFDIMTLLPALLHVEDRTSMSHSLESRVPLLDNRIAEFVASIPIGIKLKGGLNKYIFRRAVKGVIPNEILSRKDKMGFPVPISEWFKKELNKFVRDILLDKKAKKRGIYNVKGIERLIKKESKFDRQIWGLLCLELWFKQFIDQ